MYEERDCDGTIIINKKKNSESPYGYGPPLLSRSLQTPTPSPLAPRGIDPFGDLGPSTGGRVWEASPSPPHGGDALAATAARRRHRWRAGNGNAHNHAPQSAVLGGGMDWLAFGARTDLEEPARNASWLFFFRKILACQVF